MMEVSLTSAKPAKAALPVSPEVATSITVFFPPDTFEAEVVSKKGSICNAKSLKAHVGPCQSSNISTSP